MPAFTRAFLSGISPNGEISYYTKICCIAALKCNNTPTDMLACRMACFAFNTARKACVFDFPNPPWASCLIAVLYERF